MLIEIIGDCEHRKFLNQANSSDIFPSLPHATIFLHAQHILRLFLFHAASNPPRIIKLALKILVYFFFGNEDERLGWKANCFYVLFVAGSFAGNWMRFSIWSASREKPNVLAGTSIMKRSCCKFTLKLNNQNEPLFFFQSDSKLFNARTKSV